MKATALFLSIAPARRTASSLRERRAISSVVIGSLVLCFLLAYPSESLAQELSQLKNRFRANSFIQSKANGVTSGALGSNPASAAWAVEPVAGTAFFRLRNAAMPDQYIHTENGPLELGAAPAGWWSSQWELERVANTNYVRIRNRHRADQYLHTENGPLELGAAPAGWWSSQWEIIKAAPVVAAAPVEATAREDSLVLVALYKATDGPHWAGRRNWLTGPVESWAGVGVRGGRVRGLSLGINQLTGSIPPELGQLSKLTWLELGRNQLSGSIPAELGQLSNLQVLYLNDNQLSGSIPAELSQLSNLQWLYMNDNQLSGSIPAELSQLSNLERLYMNDNQLSGPVPFLHDVFPRLGGGGDLKGNPGLCQLPAKFRGEGWGLRECK